MAYKNYDSLEVQQKVNEIDNKANISYVNDEVAKIDEKVSDINSSLEEKANKSDIGSPLIANTVASMTDTSKVYVYTGSETGYTNGNWYSYNGTSWVSGGVYNSTAIGDKSIIADKTNFLEQKNLAFYKTMLHGKKMQGDGSGMTLINDTNFYVACININPNTTYSLILPEDLGLEDGYYWLKVATSTSTKEEVINNFSNSYTFDGSYKYTKTDAYLSALWVTTGANDKSVFIQLGKYKQPSYFEFLEGKANGRRYKDYVDSCVPLFNSYNKKEVDDMINALSPNNNKIFVKKETGSSYVTIFYKYAKGYVGYRYGVYGDASINLNTYRLIDIKTYDSSLNAQYTISNAPYDNEGVLKIQGEDDYIGGVHGDEKNPVLSVLIDGKMVGFDSITQCYCDEIKFILSSDIYHCDDTINKAFKKTKQTWFDINGVHVNNKWIAQDTINLEHVRACLLSVNKTDGDTKLITHYYDDKVLTVPQGVPDTDTAAILATNSAIDNVFFTGLIQAEVWGVRGGDESEYYSQITDFGTRIKPYFDCYTGKTLVVNDILTCQNNFIIRYN